MSSPTRRGVKNASAPTHDINVPVLGSLVVPPTTCETAYAAKNIGRHKQRMLQLKRKDSEPWTLMPHGWKLCWFGSCYLHMNKQRTNIRAVFQETYESIR
eukprot:1151945-Pelagomonas_calceolata.AAC.2